MLQKDKKKESFLLQVQDITKETNIPMTGASTCSF